MEVTAFLGPRKGLSPFSLKSQECRARNELFPGAFLPDRLGSSLLALLLYVGLFLFQAVT